jgi:hypothetical protein
MERPKAVEEGAESPSLISERSDKEKGSVSAQNTVSSFRRKEKWSKWWSMAGRLAQVLFSTGAATVVVFGIVGGNLPIVSAGLVSMGVAGVIFALDYIING